MQSPEIFRLERILKIIFTQIPERFDNQRIDTHLNIEKINVDPNT